MVEHEHKWGEWKEVKVWYTAKGTFSGEFRKCKECEVVEARNLKVVGRPSVMTPTISLYAATFDEEGKIRVVRRTEAMKTFVGEWELPGGGIRAERVTQARDEMIINKELQTIVKEKVGLEIEVPVPTEMIPVILPGGGDWAFVTGATVSGGQAKLNLKYLSPWEAEELAAGPEGNRILSGRKRMLQLIMIGIAFFSPNEEYRREASEIILQRYR